MSAFSQTPKRLLVDSLVLVFGTAAVIALLKMFMEQSMMLSWSILLALFALSWALFSGRAWWLPVPTTLCFGGMLQVGFKIYSYELGLLLALIAVIPLAVTRRTGSLRHSFLPPSLLALAVYLTVRLGVNLYQANLEGYPLGNIFRVFVIGLWPLVFAVPFVFFGATQCLKKAFWIMYFASVIHCVLGVAGYLLPQVLSATDFSVVLPGIYTEGIELRAAGLWLLYMSLAAWSLSGRRVHLLHSMMVLFAVFCVFLGGSRGSLGVMVALLIIWMCVERKFVLLGVFATAFVAIVAALNLNYNLIDEFPERLQRTFSILIFQSPFHDAHRFVQGSDEWHQQLAVMAIKRWTSSPWLFLFGHRLIPFSVGMDPTGQSFYDLMRAAADLGYYEAGLWTVLAITGAVGGMLYGVTLWALARPLWAWVWRERVRTLSTAFGFIAVSSTFLWFAFGWIIGHFPSDQIVLLLIARAAYEDQKSDAGPVKAA